MATLGDNAEQMSVPEEKTLLCSVPVHGIDTIWRWWHWTVTTDTNSTMTYHHE